MRQLVLESAPTISTVRQQPREYGLSCHVRTQSQTSLVWCQLGSFLHLLYSLTLSRIPLPFRLQPSFSENPSPFTLLPNLSPPYSDRLPLFSDTISLTRITFLSLDSHHPSLIFVVLLISSTHPPLFAACILFSLFGYLPLPISWRSPLSQPGLNHSSNSSTARARPDSKLLVQTLPAHTSTLSTKNHE